MLERSLTLLGSLNSTFVLYFYFHFCFSELQAHKLPVGVTTNFWNLNLNSVCVSRRFLFLIKRTKIYHLKKSRREHSVTPLTLGEKSLEAGATKPKRWSFSVLYIMRTATTELAYVHSCSHRLDHIAKLWQQNAGFNFRLLPKRRTEHNLTLNVWIRNKMSCFFTASVCFAMTHQKCVYWSLTACTKL